MILWYFFEVKKKKVALDKNLLDFLLNGCDLRFDLRSFILGDWSADHGPGDTTSSAKGWKEDKDWSI